MSTQQAIYRMELAKCTKSQMTDALLKNEVTRAEIESTLAKQENTLSTISNTKAVKAQTLSEEDELLKRWLYIDAEEADTVATNKNTISKGANLSITNMLKVALAKLNAVIIANPLIAFGVAIIGVTTAMMKLKDILETTPKEAKKAFDKAKEDVDSLKSEVDSLNSELQTTQSRIDELNAKENLTLVEQEELNRLKETNDELERELRIKRDLLTTELQEANKDAKKFFTTNVDGVEHDYNGQALQTDYITATEQRIDKIEQYNQEIKDLEDEQLKYQRDHNGKSSALLSEQIENRKNRIEEYKTYVGDAISDFMESDDYLIEGQDDGLLKRLDALYEKFDIYKNGKASVTENKIKGILSQPEFEKTTNQLEELGKSGKLSVTTLSSSFPELINRLDEAGISAKELYQYIMSLSDVDIDSSDIVNLDLQRNQAKQRFGGYSYNDRGVQATNEAGRIFDDFWNEYVKTAEQADIVNSPEFQKSLDKQKEGLDSVTLSVENYSKALEEAQNKIAEASFDQVWADLVASEDDAVKELDADLLELAEKGRLTVDTFNEADSTGYFKNLGISADIAVSKINKLVDESKQLSSMSDQISKMSEALGTKRENGFVEADTLAGFDVEVRGLESWDKFQTVLGSVTSSYEECQEAANELATEWVNSSDFLAQLTEDTKEYYETQLESMGIENYEEVIESTLALKEAKEALADVDLSDASYEDIEALIAEGEYSALVTEQMWALYYAKLAESGTFLDSSADCAQLQALANDAMLTAEAVELLNQLIQIYNGLESGAYDGNRLLRAEAVEEASRIKSELENLAKGEGVGLIAKPELKVNGNKGKKSGGGSGSSKDAWKEAYDAELKELEHMHKLGLISDEEYWKARMDLNEKYFGESSGMHEKYLEEYQENEEDILEGLKKLWEDYYDERKNNLKDLISYAEKLYDREIDSLEANIKQIEEKRDTEKKYWQGRIDAIGDEIDALEDANDQRERAIDLQEKQYQLQKTIHQRTILLYSESKGMHYVNDSKAERSAKNDLDGAENDNKIADLKKQQKDLEKQLDAILETYDSQIESIEKQIDSLKEVKSAWSEIVENQEFKELEERLKSLFGDDIKSKILSGNTDFINDIIAQYSDTSDMIRTIEDATLSDIQNMVAQYGILPENLVPISNAATDIANTLANVDTSGFNANMNNTAQASSNAAEKVQNVTTALNNLSNDVANYQMPALNTDNFTSAFAEDGGILTALNSFMERYKEICDGIPDIWNNSLAEAFGQGGGNGDPLAGGLANDTKYDTLFDPLVEALDNCKTNMETKLKESLDVFSTFQADLSGVIGVGGSEESGSSQSGTGSGKGKSPSGEKGSGSNKKSESGSGSDTIVGAIVEGGGLIDQALNGEEDSWSASFNTAKDSIHETATSIVDCIESMVETVVDACIKAIEAINMLASADDNNPNNPTPSPYGKVGHAHAEGVNGTRTYEKNAIVSEYGQRELTVLPNGKTVLTDAPTAIDLPKGSVVYNEEQTEKILKNKVTATGSAYAKGTAKGNIGEKYVLADGTVLTPVPYDDPAYDVTRKFEAYMKKTGENIDIIARSGLIRYNREMGEVVKSVTNVSSITNNNRNVQSGIHVDKIEIMCPGVTSQQIVNEVSTALDKQFGHLSQRAMQEAYKR